MSENTAVWARVVAFGVSILAGAVLLAYFVFTHFAQTDVATASADTQTLVQIQKQLNSIENRLGELESRRKAESAKAAADVKPPATALSSEIGIPHPPRPRYQVSPESAMPAQPLVTQSPLPDAASAQKLARLQQGIGELQEETTSNREAWQATTNRLAEVAGELGAQHGQILQNKDELNRFLGRTEHSTFTFELRRGSVPEPVGPIRISLRTSNQKSQRYTLCVYLQDSCVQVKDRVQYEVVELALSRDTMPFELIATKVEKDGIIGYLEVPLDNAGH
jgi:septal ring factor EnvC (AmiA/AmiB activator)